MTLRDSHEVKTSEAVGDAPAQLGSQTPCGKEDCPFCALEAVVQRGAATWKRQAFLDRHVFRVALTISLAAVFVLAVWVVEAPMSEPIAIFFLLLFPIGTVAAFIFGWQAFLAERQYLRRFEALARCLSRNDARARRGNVLAQDDGVPVVLRTLSSRYGDEDDAVPQRGVVVAALPFVVNCGGDAFLVDVPFVDVAESPSREDMVGTVALYPGDEVIVLFDEHETAVAPAWFTAHKGIDYRRRAMRRIVATAERPVVVLVCERGTNGGA